jgi:hypothetical protein
LKFKEKFIPSDWSLVIADPDYDLSDQTLANRRAKALNLTHLLAPLLAITGSKRIQKKEALR